MDSVKIIYDDRAEQLALGDFRAELSDRTPLLKIAGELMRGSIARTFHEEGSPASSWPRLALSTLRKKAYTAGHKLLILSGRLFGSITYAINGDVLTIGTNVIYAGVHQYGSADRRGAGIGPQAKIHGRSVHVKAHSFAHVYRRASGDVRGRGPSGRDRKLVSGIAPRDIHVGAHQRHQNIPPRPFLVFRPEDPARLYSGIEAYLAGKLVRIGTVNYQREGGTA